MTVLLFVSATPVQGSVQLLSRFDMSITASGHSGLHADAEVDKTTIVDFDGPARIINPQDDVRLARHHRYGCSFDAAVCAYIHVRHRFMVQIIHVRDVCCHVCQNILMIL